MGPYNKKIDIFMNRTSSKGWEGKPQPAKVSLYFCVQNNPPPDQTTLRLCSHDEIIKSNKDES